MKSSVSNNGHEPTACTDQQSDTQIRRGPLGNGKNSNEQDLVNEIYRQFSGLRIFLLQPV